MTPDNETDPPGQDSEMDEAFQARHQAEVERGRQVFANEKPPAELATLTSKLEKRLRAEVKKLCTLGDDATLRVAAENYTRDLRDFVVENHAFTEARKTNTEIPSAEEMQRRIAAVALPPVAQEELEKRKAEHAKATSKVTDAHIRTMAEDAAHNIWRIAKHLVRPELVPAVLCSNDMAQGWPWDSYFFYTLASCESFTAPVPEAERAWVALLELNAATEWLRPKSERHDSAPRKWPGDVAPLEVVKWAREALDKIPPENVVRVHLGYKPSLARLAGEKAKSGNLPKRPCLGTTIALAVETDDLPGSIAWRDHDGICVRLTGYGLALLYKAERVAELCQPYGLSVAMVAVDKPPVRTMSAMTGADPRNLWPKDADVLTDPSAPTRLEFRWAQPRTQQLELELTPADTGPMAAIAAKYGDAAVRHLLGVYAFTWYARASADEPLWWWPNEHLWLLDMPASKDNRERLRGWLENMTRTKLTAHYQQGAPLTGPIVTVSLTDGDAFKMHIHPALFRGVTDESGKLGKHWWPLPLSLLRMAADRTYGKVHTLGVVAGSMWRGSLYKNRNGRPPVAEVTVKRLADYLAISKRYGRDKTPRATDQRTADTLERTLNAGQECGLIGRWTLEGGELARLTGKLFIEPGAEALRYLNGDNLQRAAWLPATGDDLERWKDQTGMTSAEVAKLTGVNAGTLRRLCQSHRGRPLPAKVRACIRRAMWPQK